MFISDRKIYSLASRPQYLEEGFALQKKQCVKNIHFQNKEKTIEANVHDHHIYHTFIRFNEQNVIQDYRCECDISKHISGACPHVIATLKQAQIMITNSKQQQLELDRSIHEILNCFTDSIYDETIIKQPIHLEIYLKKFEHQGKPAFKLSMKAGLDKLYVIKNIRDFLDAFINKDEIEYGKAFTLNPDYHSIPKTYRAFIKELTNIHEEGHAYYATPKDLIIGEHYLKKLLKTLTNQTFFYENSTGSLKQVLVTEDAFNGMIIIEDKQDTIYLNLHEFSKVEPLTQDYHYVLYEQQVYHLTSKDIHQYLPFFKAVALSQSTIAFKGKNRYEFISKVIPFLPQEVEIPDSLKESYIQLPLKPTLYLDKNPNAIVARLSFSYGNYSFNPIQSENDIFLNHRILIREVKKEEELLNILDSAHFKVQPDSLYIDNTEDILTFIEKYLPLLQSNMDIYYSEQFKTIVKRRSLSTSIRYNEDTQLFEIEFSYDDIDFKQLKNILKSYRLKQKYYRLIDGSFLSLDDKATMDFLSAADYLDIDLDQLKENQFDLSLSESLFLDHTTTISKQDDYFNHIKEILDKQESLDFEVPETLKNMMRDYQIAGYHWLKTLNHFHLGGILADDMGLGKTLQSIAFLMDEIRLHPTLPNIIICPTSLVYNWEEEIKRFAPKIRYLIVSGNVANRKILIESIPDYQLIITSYPLIKRDILYYQGIEFNHCFLDEAQYIKNAASMNARTVKNIKAKTRFALTGTPIENSLDELWSIFDFIMPGMLLSHAQFRKVYEFPIIKEDDKKVKRKLTQRIQPFILRRMKKDVLKELPDKIETKYVVDLTKEQKELYLATLNQSRQELTQEIEASGFEKNSMKILAAITRLRQLCNHPSLFIDNYYGNSGKLDALNEIIDEALENKHKILIFSQFTTMLHLIEDQLKIKEIAYGYLDGSTPMDERAKQVRDFNKGDTPIFLISLKAGGTGLNLVGADMVIHVDPWWNPAVEQQATDRAYRIGQTKNVQVIKLITKGTVEEKIYELQNKKSSLIDSIIQPGETFISKLSQEEIFDLFK